MKEIVVDLPSGAWTRKGNCVSFDTKRALNALIRRLQKAKKKIEGDKVDAISSEGGEDLGHE